MWRVDGKTNAVYLLGSVHLLRASDHPFPSAFDSAYGEADTLVLELDMDDMDPAMTQAIVAELSTIGNGQSLSDLLGKQRYNKAEKQAADLGIPLEMFAGSEPWYVAITVEQLMLMRAGLQQEHGVEAYFVRKAAADGKEIIGLESIRQQLGFLDGMSIGAQRDLLMQVLEESAELEENIDALIRAWRAGDTQFLEQNILRDMKKNRELYRAIVLDRNKDWVSQINKLLTKSDDYLVIVGMLHLIGDNGVPALLEKRGHPVEQVQRN